MMDADILRATLVVLGMALLSGLGGYRLSLCLSSRSRFALFAAAMVIATLFASLVVGRLELAGYVSTASAIFASNITPILIAFSAGLAWTLPSDNLFSRHMRLSAMAVLSVVFFFAPLLRPILRPVVSDERARFSSGVCLQSHPATCGPAAAVTLLYHHGLTVSEHEMIKACLTSQDGTEPLALYRGLTACSEGIGFQPKLASESIRRWAELQQFPVVALVSFNMEPEHQQPSLRRILGRSAEGHAVVIFGQTADGKGFIVGDPAVGRTVWDASSLEQRFTGQAIYLARR